VTEDIQTRFNYDTFDQETRRRLRERAEQIRGLARMTASGIVEIGQVLAEVKEQLPHGRFLRWIEAEFGWKKSTAENYMLVYRNIKLPNVGNLNVDVSALYLIAAPSTPAPVREEAIRRAEHGEHVSRREVRVLLQRVKGTGELADVAVTPPRTIVDLRGQTQRPPNERRRVHDRDVADRIMELARHLESLATGLKDLDLEAAARADGFDLALAIRMIHKSRTLIADCEQGLRRVASRDEPARKVTPRPN